MTEVQKILKKGGIDTFLPDDKVWKNKFNVKSASSDSLYVVSQRKTDGEWKCSCFGNRRYGKCKHIETIRPLLEQAAQAEKKSQSQKRLD